MFIGFVPLSFFISVLMCLFLIYLDKRAASSGNLNLRNHIWENTDSDRCRSLVDHGIFERKDLLELYLEFASKVPSIFKLDDDFNIQSSQSALGDDLKSRFDKGLLRPEDIQAALHQIFTNVRLKNLNNQKRGSLSFNEFSTMLSLSRYSFLYLMP